MTKRQVFSIIKGIIIISIIGGFIWLKKTEKDINQTSKKTFRAYNAKNQSLFNDNDFSVNFENNNILNFKAKIKNPFNEIIEKSKLSLKLVLVYKKGTIKFINNSILDNYESRWEDYDFIDFFNSKNYSKSDLKNLKEITYLKSMLKTSKTHNLNNEKTKSLEASGYSYIMGGIVDSEGKYHKSVKLFGVDVNSQVTEDEFNLAMRDQKEYELKLQKLIKNYQDLYSKEDIKQLEKGLIELNSLYALDAFRENKNDVFKSNHYAYFNVQTDFKQYVKDTTDIREIPTINLFKVKKATLEVSLVASNTNGFYFNDKVKSINITEKWNDHFVFQKDDKIKEYEISNAIKISIPKSLEQRSSNSDSEIVMSKVKDIFNEEIGVRSQIVFQPKGTNKLKITKISDETKILVKYSKNDSDVNFPNWNEQISEDDKKSIVNSVKTSLISFHDKNFPNIELEWLETESGEANKNKYFKISHLTKQESNINQTSSYLFWNINESVMITYSTKLNDKEKWDKIFLRVLETFDFKNKK